uniref:Uncharacterized protein n=1 Tax=Avena sativa TaxID=4498 RepID=A0ACD5TRL6_AVESA
MEVMAQADYGGLAALSGGLARCLAEETAYTNLVFSPLSIYAALALLAAGARGATLDEILRVVGARSHGELQDLVARAAGRALRDHSGSGGPRVAFACGVWSDLTTCPLSPAFRDAVVGKYKAEAGAVDFANDPEAAREQINAWAARATGGLVGSVLGLGSITPRTRVVLANAVYFKGKWEKPFDAKRTTREPFYRLDGGAVDVPFMRSSDPQFVAVHDGFKVLKLRYQMAQAQDPFNPAGYLKQVTSDRTKSTTQFSMCIFLPDAHDGLPTLVDMIASQPGFLHEHLPKKRINVGKFQVPKFKLSFEGSLIAVLKKLGLQLPFGGQADLSGMVERDESGRLRARSGIDHAAHPRRAGQRRLLQGQVGEALRCEAHNEGAFIPARRRQRRRRSLHGESGSPVRRRARRVQGAQAPVPDGTGARYFFFKDVKDQASCLLRWSSRPVATCRSVVKPTCLAWWSAMNLVARQWSS